MTACCYAQVDAIQIDKRIQYRLCFVVLVRHTSSMLMPDDLGTLTIKRVKHIMEFGDFAVYETYFTYLCNYHCMTLLMLAGFLPRYAE